MSVQGTFTCTQPDSVPAGVWVCRRKAIPSAWAMTGLQNILIRGLGIESTWQPVSVLLAYAAGFFALAVWRFKKVEM
jgi:ABC-type multidrug transport system permease subunit